MTSRSDRSDRSDRPGQQSRGIRLDAYLARAGLASRSEARGLIRQGAVKVDGEVCRDVQRRIGAEAVLLGQREVTSPTLETDYVMHKPIGVACSHDEREAPLVFGLLDEILRRRGLEVAGRLDRATSGLLVLSTDGEFLHRLTHPARKVPKRYRIEYEGELAADAVARCRAGFLLRGDERPTLPAVLELEGAGRATLVLREGRTHQVRRMLRVLGGEVVGLHRDRIGAFSLPEDLAPGDWRPLAPGGRALLLSDKSL